MIVDQPPDCSGLRVETSQALPGAAKDHYDKLNELLGLLLECERLSQAGWSPIEDVAKVSRRVRRVTFEEGRLAFRIPAITLEQHRGGEVYLSLSIDRPRRLYQVKVSHQLWGSVVAKDGLTHPLPPPPARPAEPIPTITFCHGWFVTIEVADVAKSWTRHAHECNGERDRPALAYGFSLARLAVERIPECAQAKSRLVQDPRPEAPVWALINCAGRFGPRTLRSGGD